MAQHTYVMEVAALYMNIDYKEVEEGVLDSDTHIKLLDSLFVIGGRHAVLFFYSEMDIPPLGMNNKLLYSFSYWHVKS